VGFVDSLLGIGLVGVSDRDCCCGTGSCFLCWDDFSVGLYGIGVVVELISAILLTGWGASSWLGTTCGALEATFLVG
jgi:hypothetical protein